MIAIRRRIIQYICCLASIVCIQVAYADVATIKHATIEHSTTHNTQHTTLTLDVSQPVQYHYFMLKAPDRLVCNIKQTQLKTDLHHLPLQSTAIKTIRTREQKSLLRLVLDLNTPAITKVTLQAPTSHHGDQLIISLTTNKSAKLATHTRASHKNPEKTPLKPTSFRPIVVLIDPGHGGKDPGTTGIKGIHEKDVVLDISKDLYQLIQNTPGLTAKITRSDDHFVTLRGRLKAARLDKADLFVAIHADAYKDKYAHGASVFALSQHGASSEAARWLAQKENYSELGGVNLNTLDTEDKTLRSVLIDLSQTATIAQSLNVGTDVLNELGHLGSLHRGHVEQAPFMVLKSPDIPSILVETGFLSNPSEEKKLRSKAYRAKIANAIFKGIQQYFLHHPPQNTLYAYQKQQRQTQLDTSTNRAEIRG